MYESDSFNNQQINIELKLQVSKACIPTKNEDSLSINILCLSVWVSVCLFVSNKRQNGLIHWAQIILRPPLTPGMVYMDERICKKLPPSNF